jgi:hypothetical protein
MGCIRTYVFLVGLVPFRHAVASCGTFALATARPLVRWTWRCGGSIRCALLCVSLRSFASRCNHRRCQHHSIRHLGSALMVVRPNDIHFTGRMHVSFCICWQQFLRSTGTICSAAAAVEVVVSVPPLHAPRGALHSCAVLSLRDIDIHPNHFIHFTGGRYSCQFLHLLATFLAKHENPLLSSCGCRGCSLSASFAMQLCHVLKTGKTITLDSRSRCQE